jgi:hypothetical protein
MKSKSRDTVPLNREEGGGRRKARREQDALVDIILPFRPLALNTDPNELHRLENL